MVQNMCDLWHCTHEEALRQDPALVVPIFGYVQAKAAIEQSKDGVGELTRIQVEILASLEGETLEPIKQMKDESWLLDG